MRKLKVWGAIFAEAYHSTNERFGYAARGRAMTGFLVFCIYVLLVWTLVSPDEAVSEASLKVLLTVAPLMVYPIYFVWRFVSTIPEREIRGQDELKRLKDSIRPRVAFEVLNEGRPHSFENGDLIRMVGGGSVSNVSGKQEIICGVVRNLSAKDASSVDVRLVEMSGDNGARLRDPIVFMWVNMNSRYDDQQWETVPPRGQRTIKLFEWQHGRLGFAASGLPLEHVRFFDGGRKFKGTLAISDTGLPAVIVDFALDVSGEPVMTIVQAEDIEREDVAA